MFLDNILPLKNIISFIKSHILESLGPHHHGIKFLIEVFRFVDSFPYTEYPFNSKAIPLLKSADCIVNVHITGTDSITFCMIFRYAHVELKNDIEANPATSIFLSSDIFFEIIQGNLNADKALLAGKIRYEGSHAYLSLILEVFHTMARLVKDPGISGEIYRELYAFSRFLGD